MLALVFTMFLSPGICLRHHRRLRQPRCLCDSSQRHSYLILMHLVFLPPFFSLRRGVSFGCGYSPRHRLCSFHFHSFFSSPTVYFVFSPFHTLSRFPCFPFRFSLRRYIFFPSCLGYIPSHFASLLPHLWTSSLRRGNHM